MRSGWASNCLPAGKRTVSRWPSLRMRYKAWTEVVLVLPHDHPNQRPLDAGPLHILQLVPRGDDRKRPIVVKLEGAGGRRHGAIRSCSGSIIRSDFGSPAG